MDCPLTPWYCCVQTCTYKDLSVELSDLDLKLQSIFLSNGIFVIRYQQQAEKAETKSIQWIDPFHVENFRSELSFLFCDCICYKKDFNVRWLTDNEREKRFAVDFVRNKQPILRPTVKLLDGTYLYRNQNKSNGLILTLVKK